MTNSAQPTPASALGNITHVIVLMFENRSFDNLLGAMPGVDGVLGPNGKVNPDYYNTMHPLAPPSDDNPPAYPTPIILRLGNEYNVDNESAVFCGNSFNHDFSDAMLLDLYGPCTTGVVGGQPQYAHKKTRLIRRPTAASCPRLGTTPAHRRSRA
jgi:Phosphoesterase family